MIEPAPQPDAGAPAAEAAVGRAMRRLDDLAGRPLSEHVDAFEQVHSALSDALTVDTSNTSNTSDTAAPSDAR